MQNIQHTETLKRVLQLHFFLRTLLEIFVTLSLTGRLTLLVSDEQFRRNLCVFSTPLNEVRDLWKRHKCRHGARFEDERISFIMILWAKGRFAPSHAALLPSIVS